MTRPLRRAAQAAQALRQRRVVASRKAALHDLGAFARLLWPVVEPQRRMRWSWYHELVAQEVQAYLLGPSRDPLAVSMPPRAGKSALLSIFVPAWWWLRTPEAAIAHITVLGSNSDRDARAMRSVCESAEYDALRVEAHNDGLAPRWRMTPGETAVGRYTTTRGGVRLSRTTAGAVTGAGADLLIIDDPNDAEEVALGGAERAGRLMGLTWERYEQVWSTRLNPSRPKQIVTMQRLHEVDMVGRLVARGSPHVVLPLVFEADHPERHRRDPRAPGELLDPIFAPDVARLRLHPQRWTSQYQLRPTPREGGVFHRDTFLRYSMLPEGDYQIASLDSALKPSGKSEHAITVWTVLGPRMYLAHVERGHWAYPELRARFVGVLTRYPAARVRLVEDTAAGAPLLQDLGQTVSGLVPIRPRGSKLARAETANAAAIGGHVYLPEQSDWLADFEAQLFAFPNGAAEDVVDSLTQAINYHVAQQSFRMDVAGGPGDEDDRQGADQEAGPRLYWSGPEIDDDDSGGG